MKSIRLLHLLLAACLLLSACSPAATSTAATTQPAPAAQTAPTVTDTSVPPTNTPTPSATPTLTPVPATPTETPIPPSPTPDFQAFKESAQILVYVDDMFHLAYMNNIVPNNYVIQALDKGGYHYTNTAGLVGRFKNELLKQQWDVILVSAEARNDVSGEFFDYLHHQLKQGAAVVLETWTLHGNITLSTLYMMEECGVEVQDDYRSGNSRIIRWAAPDHPILNSPNSGLSLERYQNFWNGDIGDLLKVIPDSNATIVGSLNGSQQEQGVLVVCYDGRLVLQTFSTHDHNEKDMAPLWQNYVEYAIQQRMNYLNQMRNAPTPQPLSASQQSQENRKMNADILLYGYRGRNPLLELGLPYQRAKSLGHLLYALKHQSWDLVIITDKISGDFLPELTAVQERGVSIIIDDYSVDTLPDVYLAPFAERCGVEKEGSFLQEEPLNLQIAYPGHPVFTQPNLITGFNLGSSFYPEDDDVGFPQGVLWQTTGENPATLLVSMDGSNSKGGTVVLCSNNRTILSTFGGAGSMFERQLLENYITYLLNQKFPIP